jgi:hypothetical protein
MTDKLEPVKAFAMWCDGADFPMHLFYRKEQAELRKKTDFNGCRKVRIIPVTITPEGE